MLESVHRLQGLSLSPVFIEFPNSIEDLKCDVDSLATRARDAFAEIHKKAETRLDRIETQLTPLKLSSKLGSARTRLELLDQKQRNAVRRTVETSAERLALGMRSLDTMSPLAVMKRGYSITQKRTGDIVRDADSVKTGEQVDIRLANGSLKAKILSTSDE